MTEAEWLACADPMLMLNFLQGKASERKRRLFVVACWRCVEHLLKDKYACKALLSLEHLADESTAADPETLWDEAGEAYGDVECTLSNQVWEVGGEGEFFDAIDAHTEGALIHWDGDTAQAAVILLVTCLALRHGHLDCMVGLDHPPSASEMAQRLMSQVAMTGREIKRVWDRQRQHCAALIRCVFGNPFRPMPPRTGMKQWNENLRAWRSRKSGTVTKMAQAIYEGRAFDRLPILADALEEADCTDADILAHCRGPGPHARGCWPVDLVLGKK